MIDPTTDPRLTPISHWTRKDEYTPVALPSGRTVAMRSVDVFSLMDEDGKIPQFLKTQLEAGAKRKPGKPGAAPEVEASASDMLDTMRLTERIIRVAMVYPPIVETPEDEAAGKGVMLASIPLTDKLALLTWAMGGAAGVQNANRFPEPEKADIQHLAE